MVIFVMAFFLLFVTGGLVFSQLEHKKNSNFRFAAQAVEVSDAGLQHGLAAIPWLWNFNTQLNCGTPPCPLVSNSSFYSFPDGSAFSYTVTAEDDSDGDNNASNDANNIIILTSQSSGPSGSTRTVRAYVRRSLDSFIPPAAMYINAASATPQADASNASATGFFDLDDHIVVKGNDTNTNNSAGPKPTLYGIAATNSTVTNALINEYTGTYSTGSTGTQLHDVLGIGSEPSIATVGEALDIDTIAANFTNHASAVKYLNGLRTDSTSCPSSNPCALGTSLIPQITYIKETNDSDITSLYGSVTGYGVLVFDGRPTIGDNFKFYGLIVHKRSNGSAYINLEDNTQVYGSVLLGSYDEGDGNGKKARFGLKDSVMLYYSSQALSPVDTNWGSLLPKPARVFAWVDK